LPTVYWTREVTGWTDVSEETFQWLLMFFEAVARVASILDKEHPDNWHPIVWDLAVLVRKEAEEAALEKARSAK